MNGHDVRPARWSKVIDLYDDGEYSAIWGCYDDNPNRVLGVRWNGYGNSKGFPLSSGHPVWHVEPDFIAKGILTALLNETLSIAGSGGIKDNILTAISELALRCGSNGIHLAVALYASANKGKTTTLKLLIENLKVSGGAVVAEKPIVDGSQDMLFCCKYRGKTIGVATGGDEGPILQIAFHFFRTYNCDIVFCATRTRSDSSSARSFNENTKARSIRVIYIRKREAQEAEQAKVNSAQAKELQLLIDTNGIA